MSKNRLFFKKNLKLALSSLLVVSLVTGSAPVGGINEVSAATTTCDTYEGSNVSAQNYARWSSPIESYLTVTEDGSLMRVQYGNQIQGLLIEYYDTDYNLQSTKIVEEELPIFGGFYATDDFYFVVTGQENSQESAEVEVYRITKYDKEWNKITSTGLKDCNTTVPFDAGSCRMDTAGKYLLIRTSHEMYQSEDGYNHQANVTIQLDMEAMEITDSYTQIMNERLGYVSHSFNQFIKIEDNKIIALDHGDAGPRSFALLKYQTDVSTGSFTPNYFQTPCTLINVMEFSGPTGHNTTGATVGGFEISDTSYLVAGNSVVQDENNLTRTTRNIFISTVDKNTSEVETQWLTDYMESEESTTTPHLISLSPVAKDNYMMLWTRGNQVYYTLLDGSGVMTSEIYSMAGDLSDCVPVVVNDKVVWYTWDENVIRFYEISLTDISNNNKTEIVNGHVYENQGITDGIATLKCSVCEEETTINVATNFNVWWNEDGSYSYSSAFVKQREIGDDLYYWVDIIDNVNQEVEVVSSDEEIATIEKTSDFTGIIHSHKSGKVTITIYPTYNPDFQKSYELTIFGSEGETEEGGNSGSVPGTGGNTDDENQDSTITPEVPDSGAGESGNSGSGTIDPEIGGGSGNSGSIPWHPGSDDFGNTENGSTDIPQTPGMGIPSYGDTENQPILGEDSQNANQNTNSQLKEENNVQLPEKEEADSKLEETIISQKTVAKNKKYTKKGLTYKVTKVGVSGKAEVAVTSSDKKIKTATIPATIIIDGIKCNVTSISAKAFQGRKNLKKVVIGVNVKKIGSKAFLKCSQLKNLVVKATGLQSVGKQAVKGIHKKAVMKMPKKKLSIYKKLFGKNSGVTKSMRFK